MKPKKSIDLYATMKKMQEMKPLVLGVYVNVAALTASANVKIHLKLRIPVSAFMILYNLKFFPNCVGRLTIKMYPSYKNIVIVPVIQNNFNVSPALKTEIEKGPSCVELGFMNINQEMNNHMVVNNARANNEAWTISKQTFKCDGTDCCTDKCKIRLATIIIRKQF